MTLSIPSQKSYLFLEIPKSQTTNSGRISVNSLEIPFNRIRIAHASLGLLRLFARITRPIHGIVCAAINLDNPSCLINWISPVRDHSLFKNCPDWDDLRQRKSDLREEGRTIIGEFHTSKNNNLTLRDKQNMQYHFLINQPHLQLIATPNEVIAYLYNGECFLSKSLEP